MRFTIRTKLILGFSLILLLSFIARLFSDYGLYRVSRAQIYEIHLEKARNASSQIQTMFTQINFSLLAIAKEYTGGGTSFDQLRKVIGFTMNQNPTIQALSIINPNDKELIRYTRTEKEIDPTLLNYIITNEYYEKALNGLVSISKVYSSQADQSPRIDIYYPITLDRKIVGTIKAQVSLTRLWDLLTEIRLGEQGVAYVVDEEGRLLMHPRFTTLSPFLKNREIVRDLLTKSADEIRVNYEYTNEANISVFANGVKIPGINWIVIIEEPKTQAFSELYSIMATYFAAIIISTIALLILAITLSNNIAKPIRNLNQTALELVKGNYSKRAAIQSDDEIGTLAKTFNTMVNQLSEKIDLLTKRDQELRQNQANTLSERNKLEIVLQGITDAVIAVDLNRRVIIINHAAEELTGFSIGEAINAHVDSVIRIFDEYGSRIDAGIYCPIQHNTYEGIIYQKNNLSLFTKNNHHRYVTVVCGKIAESESVNFGPIITLHDITEEMELDKMKLDFVSLAAHELRTPLTSIRGYLDAFKQEAWEKINPDEQQMINRVDLSAQQLSSLMENLLSVSKIENGTYQLNLEEIDWTSFVGDRVTDLRRQADEHKLTLFWNPSEINIPKVCVDKFRIGEVLDNFVSNAIRYTSKGSITISAQYDPVKKLILTEITDTGQGVPPEAIPHMFSKFFRVSGTLEQGSKGTGLGLYISKAIVELHHGEVWVNSNGIGRGATFGFSLPINQPSEDKA